MIFFRQFSVCRKYCTGSFVKVTAVGIDWRSGWTSSTSRAVLTMQRLPRVSGDMVGATSTLFKHLEGKVSAFNPACLHILCNLSSHRSRYHYGANRLTDPCLLEDRRNHPPQGARLISVTPAATIQLQTPCPVSPILGLPSQVRHWPPTGRTWAS